MAAVLRATLIMGTRAGKKTVNIKLKGEKSGEKFALKNKKNFHFRFLSLIFLSILYMIHKSTKKIK